MSFTVVAVHEGEEIFNKPASSLKKAKSLVPKAKARFLKEPETSDGFIEIREMLPDGEFEAVKWWFAEDIPDIKDNRVSKMAKKTIKAIDLMPKKALAKTTKRGLKLLRKTEWERTKGGVTVGGKKFDSWDAEIPILELELFVDTSGLKDKEVVWGVRSTDPERDDDAAHIDEGLTPTVLSALKSATLAAMWHSELVNISHKAYISLLKTLSKVKKSPKANQVRIPITHPGSLTELGFRLEEDAARRQAALEKAVGKFGFKETMSKLNALRVFFKNKQRKLAKKVEADMKTLRKKFRPTQANRNGKKRFPKTTKKLTQIKKDINEQRNFFIQKSRAKGVSEEKREMFIAIATHLNTATGELFNALSDIENL